MNRIFFILTVFFVNYPGLCNNDIIYSSLTFTSTLIKASGSITITPSLNEAYMKTLETYTDIKAPASIVWQVLTDFNNYNQWNPIITRIDGKLAKNEKLKVTLLINKHSRTITPICLNIRRNKELRWRRKSAIPGFYNIEHIFEIQVLNPKKVRLFQREYASGLFPVLFWKKSATVTLNSFKQLNQAIKHRSENKN